jgi:putative molybdopterin biosynthesis protein
MDEEFLYQKIKADIRQRILEGQIKPGERIQSVRELSEAWECTPGTIQHAFKDLVHEGLLVSQPGRGTSVAGTVPSLKRQRNKTLRRATLVNHTEAFLLEHINSGYSISEIQNAVEIALDRWRSEALPQPETAPGILKFCGSHDLLINNLARSYFGKIEKNTVLNIEYVGSLGGLVALAEGRADIAGCHLWDAEYGEYNLPFIRRVIPGKKLAVITLAQRRQGLIVPPGNPLAITGLNDLTRGGVRFINRQPGSGTRVWLDTMLSKLNLSTEKITGYEHECMNHSSVARAIATGNADVGLGLELAAKAFGLDFVFLNLEQYDLVMLESTSKTSAVMKFNSWLASDDGKSFINRHIGYESELTGRILHLVTN